MCFVALKAWSNQLQAGLFYFTFRGCQTQGLLPFFFFFLALSLLLSGQKITIWGFLECWRAFHPFADLRQKPCFDCTAYFVGRHRSLAGWITHWIPDCRKNHTALWGSSRTLCEIMKWGNWAFLSSLPFLLSSSTPFFLHFPWLWALRNPTTIPHQSHPLATCPLGYFASSFWIHWGRGGVLRAHKFLGLGKAGGYLHWNLQLWVMRCSTPALVFTLPDDGRVNTRPSHREHLKQPCGVEQSSQAVYYSSTFMGKTPVLSG